MSEKYSSEFKAKVALEAVSQGRSVIEEIANKYDIKEEEVIAWASKLQDEVSGIFTGQQGQEAVEDEPEAEEVTLSSSNALFNFAVDRGVTKDDLNYNIIFFWSLFGVALLAIFIVGLVYFTQFSLFETQKEVSSRSSYSEARELLEAQQQELNSFGVVDLENGVYRVPIDSVINRMAID